MKNLIPADTVDTAGNVGENTNNLIPADTVDTAGNVGENTNNLIPADTVDTAGNVGENTNNLIPEDTVDTAENVQETVKENTNNLIPSDTVDASGENTENLIPADTVDASGNVWETVGENIRRGRKEFSINDAKEIVNIMFPVGSVFIGENSFILSVGTWHLLTETSGRFLRSGNTITSGDSYKDTAIVIDNSTTTHYTSIRIYKRIN